MRVKKETEVKKRGRKPLNKPIKKKPKKGKRGFHVKKRLLKSLYQESGNFKYI